jgi:hypothetical protein
LVGTAGFEPTDGGIKNRCLTTWRRPNKIIISSAFKKERGFLRLELLEVNKLLG